MGKRTWVKIYCDRWIEGSLRQEKPALRGVWADLLALCGGGQYGNESQIKVRNNVGFTDVMLSRILNITPQLWGICKKRLIETDRIVVNEDNILTIKNWKKYQSEYERQKPQRTKSAEESAEESAGIDYRLKTIDYRLETVEEERAPTSFKIYKEKLVTKFPEFDIDDEWERCQIWYRDHNKKIKSPSLSLGNWCRKERQITKDKKGGQSGKQNGQHRDPFAAARGEVPYTEPPPFRP